MTILHVTDATAGHDDDGDYDDVEGTIALVQIFHGVGELYPRVGCTLGNARLLEVLRMESSAHKWYVAVTAREHIATEIVFFAPRNFGPRSQ